MRCSRCGEPLNSLHIVDGCPNRPSDYTTEPIREDYATRVAPHLEEARREAFDRWLEQVKAEVWDECCYETMGQGTVQIPDNPYRKEKKNERA